VIDSLLINKLIRQQGILSKLQFLQSKRYFSSMCTVQETRHIVTTNTKQIWYHNIILPMRIAQINRPNRYQRERRAKMTRISKIKIKNKIFKVLEGIFFFCNSDSLFKEA
jgi:hypothetical protein